MAGVVVAAVITFGSHDLTYSSEMKSTSTTKEEIPPFGSLRIGLALHYGGGYFDSVKQVSANISAALEQQYEVSYYDAERLADDEGSLPVAQRLVEQSDVLLGFGKVLYSLLRARHDLNSKVPCVIIALGSFPRGALQLRRLLPFLRETDTLVVNCAADEALARAFFPTAHMKVLPLTVSDALFYPSGSVERTRFRSEHGLKSDSQLLLYTGRITVEKNLHTTLRVFAALLPRLSDPYLFLVGPFVDTPFAEVGAVPVSYVRALARAMEKLRIPEDRVSHLGVLAHDELRAAYGAADVMVNLTLHHDENFGLSQIEAMACGTPVVGTGWGGLHDTIREGITGEKVRVVSTPLGVKVDWWDAANAIYDMLVPSSGVRRRLQAQEIPIGRYSFSVFARDLVMILEHTIQNNIANAPPLLPSAFAKEFWETCTNPQIPHAQYAYGTRSFELYCQLISHYTGGSSSATTLVAEDYSDGVLVLGAPVSVSDDGSIAVNDPLFPTKLFIPSELKLPVLALVALFTHKPVLRLNGLNDALSLPEETMSTTLRWMISQGLVLLSRRKHARISPEDVPENLSAPLFAIQTIDRKGLDFLAVRD